MHADGCLNISPRSTPTTDFAIGENTASSWFRPWNSECSDGTAPLQRSSISPLASMVGAFGEFAATQMLGNRILSEFKFLFQPNLRLDGCNTRNFQMWIWSPKLRNCTAFVRASRSGAGEEWTKDTV